MPMVLYNVHLLESTEGEVIVSSGIGPHKPGFSLDSTQAADPLPPPLRVAKTGRNNLKEEFTPLLPTGIGERF
jgi:hypothetical protein